MYSVPTYFLEYSFRRNKFLAALSARVHFMIMKIFEANNFHHSTFLPVYIAVFQDSLAVMVVKIQSFFEECTYPLLELRRMEVRFIISTRASLRIPIAITLKFPPSRSAAKIVCFRSNLSPLYVLYPFILGIGKQLKKDILFCVPFGPVPPRAMEISKDYDTRK